MKLRTAIPMHSLRGQDDFGRRDPDERRARHGRRRGRRRRRGQRPPARRHRPRRDSRRDDDRSVRRQRPERERPERRPSSTSLRRVEREAELEPAPAAWEPEWDQPDVLDVEWEEVEAESEPAWLGAARATRLPARWSPPARLGRHLRLQAAAGHRAAVIELKPGLFLVAELSEQVARSEFGVAAVLAPLVVKAASKAIQHRQQTPPQERLLYRLLHQGQGQDGQGQPPRRLFMRPDGQVQDEQGRPLYRIFHPQPGQPQAAPEEPALQPAPGAGHGTRALLPPPEMGWAEGISLDLAEVNRG